MTLESIIERWRHFCEKPPKGFEKYFRQGKQTSAAKNVGEIGTESKKTAAPPKSSPPPSSTSAGNSSKSKSSSDWNFGMFGPSSSGSGKSGGSGRPIGGNEGNEKEKWLIIGAMAAVTLLGAVTLMEMGYKEIAWKEFVNK